MFRSCRFPYIKLSSLGLSSTHRLIAGNFSVSLSVVCFLRVAGWAERMGFPTATPLAVAAALISCLVVPGSGQVTCMFLPMSFPIVSFAVHPQPFLALSRTGVPKDEARLNIQIPIISCTSSIGTPGREGNLFPGRDVHRHAAFFADKPAS